MRQALVGLSIFIGLQLAFAVVLLGVTMLETWHVPRPTPVPAPTPVTEEPSEGSIDRAA